MLETQYFSQKTSIMLINLRGIDRSDAQFYIGDKVMNIINIVDKVKDLGVTTDHILIRLLLEHLLELVCCLNVLLREI